MIAALAATAYQLRVQGRLWMCSCEYLLLWSGDAWSSDNSQHLLDPYSFTHVLHGFAFYGLFWLVGARWGWTAGLRLVLAAKIALARSLAGVLPLGIAFQLNDDLLGIWGEEQATGKEAAAKPKPRSPKATPTRPAPASAPAPEAAAEPEAESAAEETPE